MRRPLLTNLDLELDINKVTLSDKDNNVKFDNLISKSKSNSPTKKLLLILCTVLCLICICLMLYCMHLIHWTNEHVKLEYRIQNDYKECTKKHTDSLAWWKAYNDTTHDKFEKLKSDTTDILISNNTIRNIESFSIETNSGITESQHCLYEEYIGQRRDIMSTMESLVHSIDVLEMSYNASVSAMGEVQCLTVDCPVPEPKPEPAEATVPGICPSLAVETETTTDCPVLEPLTCPDIVCPVVEVPEVECPVCTMNCTMDMCLTQEPVDLEDLDPEVKCPEVKCPVTIETVYETVTVAETCPECPGCDCSFDCHCPDVVCSNVDLMEPSAVDCDCPVVECDPNECKSNNVDTECPTTSPIPSVECDSPVDVMCEDKECPECRVCEECTDCPSPSPACPLPAPHTTGHLEESGTIPNPTIHSQASTNSNANTKTTDTKTTDTPIPVTIASKFKTPLVTDYALLSSGSTVLYGHTTATFIPSFAFTKPLWNILVNKYHVEVGIVGPPEEALSIPAIAPPAAGTSTGTGIGIGTGATGQPGLEHDQYVGLSVGSDGNNLVLGRCWAMEGTRGNLTILLSKPIRISSIAIEHIGRNVARNIQTAPRQFMVIGYTDMEHLDVAEGLESGYYEEVRETDGQDGMGPGVVDELSTGRLGYMLVQGSYNIDTVSTNENESIVNDQEDIHDSNRKNRAEDVSQRFPVASYRHLPLVQVVKLHILNNYGNEDFTCLYRFKIHGDTE